jgi:hypothetical protein
LELETPSKQVAEGAGPEIGAKRRPNSASAWTLGIFFALWVAFYAINRGLPYLRNGSDIISNAKHRIEERGRVFPANSQAQRVIIFGDSKILAGFLPSLFDQLAAARHLQITSFNSGFPGSDVFLPQLKAMCRRGQAPEILFLTLPWRADPPGRSVFHLVQDDHAVIQELFPFRNWLRDATDFFLSARGHGGVLAHYREAEQDERRVVVDRGYYLITEQSRFPGGRIPDDFHLATDRPDQMEMRTAPASGSEIGELSTLIRQYRMQCYFVPSYYRIGEYAPSPVRNDAFAATVEGLTPCKLLGPEYFLYPNRLFSDQTHLNTEGARVFTEELFHLVQDRLGKGSGRALQ